jgi:carboxylesterase
MIPGAEAWSSPGAADAGVLVLHGFTGNPVSLRPLAGALADAGFAVEVPLLPGHGTTHRDLARTTWRDWAQEAAEALERLRARTRAQVVVGLSMGGALTLHLAETRGDDLAGIVLINPSVFNLDPRMRLLPALRFVVPSLAGVGNDIAKPGGDERPYARMPLKALHSLTDLWRLVRGDLGSVKVPVLLFTSRQDHVVEPENSATVLAGISSADVEQVWLERSYHVATLDHDAPEIERRTVAFTRRVTGLA